MGKGAVKKRKEEAKARKQQASAASALSPADDNEPNSSPSPSHEPQTNDTLSIPKRGRGRPRKNPTVTLPPPMPRRSTANITPFTSDDLSETESIGDKHPIETIIKTIQQPSSASSGNPAESSDDDSDGSESIDTIDLDDGSESDSSEPVLVVRTGKSGHAVKAAKKPKNTGRKVKKTTHALDGTWLVCANETRNSLQAPLIDKPIAFEIKIRINDIASGTCTPETIKSTITWDELQGLLLLAFDVHPSSLHAQYRLSTEKKDTLLCDLTSQKQLHTLIDFIRPKRGNSKQVVVDMYNKRDVQAENSQSAQSQSGKVSIHVNWMNV